MPTEIKPEIVVFAGPNGSGKSTFIRFAIVKGIYINADHIKKSTNCDDMTAAKQAEALRERLLAEGQTFTFETVLSTPRNLELLARAKAQGYFVRGYFIFTRNCAINLTRVLSRAQSGGHDVPADKIAARYQRSLAQLPRLVEICDICHVYDNSQQPERIFKKRKREYFFFPSQIWPKAKIEEFVGVRDSETEIETQP